MNVAASGRGDGTAQPWGLETKIWAVSHPRSLAVWMVFARPPEVRRWRPILFVLSGMAQILAADRPARRERYNHSDYENL
jgi:hypothetical protein